MTMSNVWIASITAGREKNKEKDKEDAMDGLLINSSIRIEMTTIHNSLSRNP